MLPSDARFYQICFLCLFLFLGIGTRDWTLRPEMILVAIATCATMQWLALVISDRPRPQKAAEESGEGDRPIWQFNLPSPEEFFHSLPSALITALGLSLLLRVDHYSTMILAASGAILSKSLLRLRDKHIFNPANFGIVLALLLTQDAWVSPGQWGEEGWYALVFLGAGGVVLQRVGRWDTTVAFLAADAALEAGRNLWLGWSWDVWAHRLMSGSLLLFALFMLTDPRTIPNARVGRLVWAIAIATLTFILRNYFFLSTAVFWALFALAPLSFLLDLVFPAPRFTWTEPVEAHPVEGDRAPVAPSEQPA
jgi:Na+-transporting NADH:ubiquinone oxidoreductase subunit NqrB